MLPRPHVFEGECGNGRTGDGTGSLRGSLNAVCDITEGRLLCYCLSTHERGRGRGGEVEVDTHLKKLIMSWNLIGMIFKQDLTKGKILKPKLPGFYSQLDCFQLIELLKRVL